MKPGARLAALIFSVTIALATSGCLALEPTEGCELGIGKPPSEQSKGGAVVLFQAAEDFPNAQTAIVQSDQLRTALPMTKDEVPFSLAIAAADGSPNLLFQSSINFEFGEIELDLEEKRYNAH